MNSLNTVLKLLSIFVLIPNNLLVTAHTVARYDNYRLYKLEPSAEEHLELLRDIEFNSDSYTFLVEPRTVNTSVLVVVAPHKFADFESILYQENISHEIKAHNVQSLIDDEQTELFRVSESFGWQKYNSLESIHKWIDETIQKYPEVASPIYAGESYEKRVIKGVKLSHQSGNPGIFIEGGMHAREWISPAVVTYLLHVLLSSRNETIRNMAKNFDWYIVPVVNPDGYVYTHTTNRFWRKTRKPYGRRCVGADPNRNFNFHFAEKGTSKNPCSDVYAGPSGFSEIEMKTYSDYLTSLKDKIHTFIGFHAFSQILLFPYGHTSKKVKNFDDLMDIGKKAIKALATRYNTKYRVGNVYNAIYPVSGSSMDWVYGVLSVPIVYTYELRPKPTNQLSGFELPSDQIIPTALETIDSVAALIDRAEHYGYYRSQRSVRV